MKISIINNGKEFLDMMDIYQDNQNCKKLRSISICDIHSKLYESLFVYQSRG